jgi:hypothetical protein
MPPALRFWGGLGHRGLSGSVRPQADSATITPCESILSLTFFLYLFCLFRSKAGNASLADLKECELVRPMSFLRSRGASPAAVNRTAFLSDGSA